MYVESLIHPSRVETITRFPSAGDGVSTTGGHRHADVGQHARVFLDGTNVSGTSPALTMNLYGVINNRTYFLTAFPAVTAVGTYSIRLDNVPDLVVAAPSPVSGTNPSFTCEVRCVR